MSWNDLVPSTGQDATFRPFETEVGDNEVVLWAETAAEADLFLQRMERNGAAFEIDRAFVGKRSVKDRGNRYIGGTFYEYDAESGGAVESGIIAPKAIVDLVQWCASDVMLSRGAEPLISIEDTTHIAGNNLFQRLPRVARSSFLGVPSVIFQGIGPKLTGKSRTWALHRFLSAYLKVNLVGSAPCLTVFYEGEKEAAAREDELIRLAGFAVSGDGQKFGRLSDRFLAKMKTIHSEIQGPVPPIRCIDVTDDEVRVLIGVRPERKSWAQKGSGQMDTYVGLIFAARLLFALQDNGEKTKEVVAFFKNLPPDFWWFADSNHSLYNTLPKEFADRYEYGSDELGRYDRRPV